VLKTVKETGRLALNQGASANDAGASKEGNDK
jgi:hypothetical protein